MVFIMIWKHKPENKEISFNPKEWIDKAVTVNK